MKPVEKHIVYYVSLFLIIALGVVLAFQMSYNPRIQMAIVALTAFWYVVWGIAHHIREHDISAKIVVEYVLMASLGISVVFFLVMGKI